MQRGKQGALQTLQEMKRLTIEAIQSQLPRDIVVSLIHHSYVHNPDLLVAALDHWLRLRFTIIDEFEELLRGPLLCLQEIELLGRTSGDCDDAAMLGAALLGSSGALIRFRCIEPQADGSFSHVLAQYKYPRRAEWSNFDITVAPGAIIFTGPGDLVYDIVS